MRTTQTDITLGAIIFASLVLLHVTYKTHNAF
jgi:hypothetical protein